MAPFYSPPKLTIWRTVGAALLLALAAVGMAWGQTSLRLGVLAYRPQPQSLAQWQPLAEHLQRRLGLPVQLSVYNLQEFEGALAGRTVDVVLTTPGHYIALRARHNLSAPLVTQVSRANGQDVAAMGGVIFARKGSAVLTLQDVVGKRVATTGTDFPGGYQMQAAELVEAHLPLPGPDLLQVTGLPQDLVVDAVLNGQAEVGFVRTGVIEALEREGRLSANDIQIVAPQDFPSLPFVSSTRLYPEWPVAVAAQVSEPVARRLAVALLSLPADSPAARAAGISGFSVPADYSSVDTLLRKLQLPPYDVGPDFTLADLWRRYPNGIVATLGALTLLFSAAGAWLLVQNAQIRRSRARYQRESQRISEIIWGTNTGTWEWNIRTGEVVLNERWADMMGFTLDELAPINIHTWMQRAHPDDVALSAQLVERCFRREAENYLCELRMRHKNGEWIWVLNRGRVVEWSVDGQPLRMSGTQSDITERKQTEQGLRASEMRFRHLFESSPDPCWLIKDGRFADCNPAALKLLNYTDREEILQHPARLSPERQPDGQRSADKAEEMMRIARERGMFRFEWEHCKADGSGFPVEVTLARLDLLGGDVLYCVWRDITERKRAEKRQLHHNRILAMLAERQDLQTILEAIALDVESILPGVHCCIQLMSEDGSRSRIYASPGLPDTVRKALDQTDSGIETGWSQPILSAQGGTLGSLTLYHALAHAPTDEDIEWMQAEARLASVVIEKTNSDVHQQLAASVFTHAREGIIIADADGTIVDVNDTFTHITGYTREEAIGRNPRFLQSGRQDPAFYAEMWRSLKERGHWSGDVWNCRKDGDIYAETLTISVVRDATGAVQNYVALFTDITAIKENQRQLEHFAHFDALTGLPNRVLLADRLQQAMLQTQRRGQSLAVCYLDLDGFKAINDQFNHSVGDELLITLSHRMKTALRDGDTLARIGGDEFVAILVDLEHSRDCEAVLERLLLAASTPVNLADTALKVSVSIGVTLFPQDAADADQLMRHADQAMYVAKLAGKNRFHHFDVAHDTAVKTRHEDLEHIALALTRGEFVLHYQPKVNMKTGEVVGAEALVRWQHPERGLLPPAAFLPVIENHPLSIELGEWVIDSALAQLDRWYTSGLHLPVSVNIGVRQLQQDAFVQRLQSALQAHPLVPPLSLELEVLETSAMEDIGQVSRVMHACRTLGVGFALDDFGTGYSSLTYLKHLPAELLKIDQSFIRDMLDDPDDLAIVESVIGLAAAFRRNVIAEGVETLAHGELLLTIGCELAQGYAIARPMPAEALADWAARWRPDPQWSAWRERTLSRDDRSLVFMEVGHRYWLRALEAFLRGDLLVAPYMEAPECHFGRWQTAEGQGRFGDHPLFIAAVSLHDQLHVQAKALVRQTQPGALSETTQAELMTMRQQLDQLSGLLRQLLRPDC